MREIEFRFWDKTLNKMIYRHLQPCDCENEDIEVMQFTGLYDCNDNKIFEGDILIDDEEDTKWQVFWCSYHGAWEIDDNFSQGIKDGWRLGQDANDFKIIGNIYETKIIKT